MKNKKAFTLGELLISLFLIAVLVISAFWIVTGFTSQSSGGWYTWMFPKQAQAYAMQDLADQMKVSNQLRAQELAREQNNTNSTH